MARLYAADPDAFERMFMPDGYAAQRTWTAEDGWIVVYTTERVTGGKNAGRFVTMAYRPRGRGSRTGKARQWIRVYLRGFSTRKAAKARAVTLYRQHSPKWNAKYPVPSSASE